MFSNHRIRLNDFEARLLLLEMLPGARRIAGHWRQPATAVAPRLILINTPGLPGRTLKQLAPGVNVDIAMMRR
jgi:hypothetical protein